MAETQGPVSDSVAVVNIDAEASNTVAGTTAKQETKCAVVGDDDPTKSGINPNTRLHPLKYFHVSETQEAHKGSEGVEMGGSYNNEIMGRKSPFLIGEQGVEDKDLEWSDGTLVSPNVEGSGRPSSPSFHSVEKVGYNTQPMANRTLKKITKRKYDASFKIEVIKFAETNSNRYTGTHFGVDEKLVRVWKKQKEELESLPPHKKRLGGAGRKAAFPQMEEMLVFWIQSQKAANVSLTRADIQSKAIELASVSGTTMRFTASQGWLDNFFRRKKLSWR